MDHDGLGPISAETFEGFRAYLLAVAGRRLGPELTAKVGASDLVQETLLAAGRDARAFRGAGLDDLQAWLKGILLHRLANAQRQYHDTAKRSLGREVPLAALREDGPHRPALADTATSACGAAMRDELRETIAHALAALPDRHREVVLGRYRDGLGFEAIGERLGISPDAARKLWGRAVLRLRAAIGPAHDPD
ncbi:sigma-70 family RNA polymerase sigma factor [Aquisphaera giovannonii]|uniref:sigma-70 family RNA polymerase sigma factor n=1 Tax=Aquisphaera giovannonii TaxID=406548 RepID=UPI00143CD989|nr:sigma-70 family RNA polymerase sigma factor [Aquisphaera giovannonii]